MATLTGAFDHLEEEVLSEKLGDTVKNAGEGHHDRDAEETTQKTGQE